MSVLNSNTFLESLIQTGPDASLNLFAVHFLPNGKTDYDSMLSLRTVQFPTPKRDVQTVDIPYQNISLKKISYSSDIDRTINLNIRIDEQYKTLAQLRELQVIDEYGLCDFDESRSCTITVDALRPYQSLTHTENYITAYRWVFYGAYIVTVGSMSYSYSDAAPASVPVTFVYKFFEEYPYDISMESLKFVQDMKDLWNNGKNYIAKKKAARAANNEAREQISVDPLNPEGHAQMARTNRMQKEAQERRKQGSMSKNYKLEGI